MTKPEQPKPIPLPVLLVYGKPTSQDIPQAAWFRVEDRSGVTTAAQTLKFSVVEIKTEADRPLIAGVHEGVLKAGGRLIVGSVTIDVYQRIEAHVQKLMGNPTPTNLRATAPQTNSLSEQNMNIEKPADLAAPDKKTVTEIAGKPSATSPASVPSDPWSELKIGSHVVAKHWEDDGEPYGWWIGKITSFENSDFVVVWLDFPSKKPPFRIERKNVAILHPAFELKTEKVRKRR